MTVLFLGWDCAVPRGTETRLDADSRGRDVAVRNHNRPCLGAMATGHSQNFTRFWGWAGG